MARTFWLLVALASSTFAQSPILDTIKKLQGFSADEGVYDIPPALASLHQKMKHQLRDFVIDAMNRGADVASELAKAGITINSGDGRPAYGQILGVNVEWKPNGLSTWAAVKTSLGIRCGQDSSLYLVERDESGWTVRLEIESNLGSSISNAFGWPQYAFSKAGFADDFFVVATNIMPSCASVWQEQRLQVFTMRAAPSRAAQVLKKEMTICIDDDSALKMEDGGFSLEYLGEQQLSPGNRRTHVLHYALKGDSMIRIAPIARRPEDFVDEWRDLPWEEAKQWSAGELQKWHVKLKATTFDGFEAGECSGKSPRWQVRLDAEINSSDDDTELFVTVIEKDGVYYLESVDTRALPGCPGYVPR